MAARRKKHMKVSAVIGDGRKRGGAKGTGAGCLIERANITGQNLGFTPAITAIIGNGEGDIVAVIAVFDLAPDGNHFRANRTQRHALVQVQAFSHLGWMTPGRAVIE